MRSNENFHGLRRPYAQISLRPAFPTNGFEAGFLYWREPTVPLMLIRRILPSRRFLFCALLGASPLPPPSPVPMYR